MHSAMDAVGVLSAIEPRGRRLGACVPVPNPILPRLAGLGPSVKLPNAIRLGPVLRETQVIR